MTYLKSYFVALFRLLVISLVSLSFGNLLVNVPTEFYIIFTYISVLTAFAGPIGIWIEGRVNAKTV